MFIDDRLKTTLKALLRDARTLLDEYDRNYLILDTTTTQNTETRLMSLIDRVATESHVKLPETYTLHYTDGLGVVRDIKIGKKDTHLYAKESYMFLSHKINNMNEEN